MQLIKLHKHFFIALLLCNIISSHSFSQTRWWEAANPPTAKSVLALATAPGGKLFAGSAGAGVFLSTNNGKIWKNVTNDLPSSYIRSVVVAPNGTVFCGIGNGLFRSSDDGVNWISAPDSITSIRVIETTKDGGIFVAGDRGFFYSVNAGVDWSFIGNIPYTHISSIKVSSNHTIYVTTLFFEIYRSIDYGKTWDFISPLSGNQSSTPSYITSNDKAVVVAFRSGEIYHSANNGDIWTKVDTNQIEADEGIYALSVDSSGDFLAATYDGGIYRSSDNGVTWNNESNGVVVHRIFSFATDANGYTFATTKKGEVFRSRRSSIHESLSVAKFRTFSQSDWISSAAKIPKTGILLIPTTGNICNKLFDRTFRRTKDSLYYPGGLVLGIVRKDSSKNFGWIRLVGKGNIAQKFLPKTNEARGFDSLKNKIFIGELNNPNRKLYDNVLAGELLALKLNIAASDEGFTHSDFGELVFADSSQPTNSLNNFSLRTIALKVDTTLTMYQRLYSLGSLIPPLYNEMAQTLSQINNAFRGTIDTVSTFPIVFTGVKTVNEVSFLHLPSGKSLVNSSDDEKYSKPFTFSVSAFPSPFNPTTKINVQISHAGFVVLKVYNILGKEIATLIDNEHFESGDYEIPFTAENLSSGIYFVEALLNSNDGTRRIATTKIVLLK